MLEATVVLAQQGNLLNAVHAGGNTYLPLIAFVVKRHGPGVYVLLSTGMQCYLADHVYECHGRDRHIGYKVCT
jgi:hypothetical protein